MVLGLGRCGRFVTRVPHSIVVGFTIGIAATIALSQVGEVLGLRTKLATDVIGKATTIAAHFGEINGYAILLGLLTFLITKALIRISPFVPAPLIGIGFSTLVGVMLPAGNNLILVKDKYGSIPVDFLVFTGPREITLSAEFLGDLAYFVVAIVFVAAIESLLCSRMADRLAENKGLPFNPDKELWGQGMVNVIAPLLNGFPHTGALARTATNIKVGAISPLAGIFKFALKLTMAAFLARYLEAVPMACIGGILLFVAVGMVKRAEVLLVLQMGRLQMALMIYTAVMVILTDFLIGVLSAIVIWIITQLAAASRPQIASPAPVEVKTK
jgi:SulP family sulfate permease